MTSCDQLILPENVDEIVNLGGYKVLGDKRGSFIVVLKRLPKIGKNLLLPAG